MAQYDFDLRDYWRIIRKRKTLILLAVILTGIASYGFATFGQPLPNYEATASVKIERVNNLGSMLLGIFTWGSGDNIATQAAIIQSFPVLVSSAKRLGWMAPLVTPEQVRKSDTLLAPVEQLKTMLEVEREGQTNLINIKATSEDPAQAAQVANTVAEAYRDYNIEERNSQTLKTKEFIEGQLAETLARLNAAEEKLRTFKEENGLMLLDAEASSTLSALARMDAELERVSSLAHIKSQELQNLQRDGDLSENLTEAIFAEDPQSLLRELTGKVSLLSSQRRTLLLDFTPENPEVLALTGRIAGIINEVKQELTSQINSLTMREGDLSLEMERLKAKNETLPRKGLAMARLQRGVELNQTLYEELQKKHQEILIQESGRIEEVSIVRPAMSSLLPVNQPSRGAATATGIVIGLIVGLLAAFIVETLDTSIGTIEDVENFLQVPVLGIIPTSGHARDKGKRDPKKRIQDIKAGLVSHFDPTSVTAEAYGALCTNFQYVGSRNQGNAFLVTSSSIQEGKTFNVVNLALAMAQAGQRTLLVEADLRRPSVYRMFGINREPGLTDFVMGNYPWRQVVNSIVEVMLGEFELDDIMKAPGLDNLHVLTAGTIPPHPTEILRSPRFAEFLEEARKEYDYVLIDSPPVLPVADATVISTIVDGVVIVYEVGKIARTLLKRAKLTLDNVRANVVGVILNNVKPDISPDFQGYHYLYYGSDQSSQDHGGKGGKGAGAATAAAVLVLAALLAGAGLFWPGFSERIGGLFRAAEPPKMILPVSQAGDAAFPLVPAPDIQAGKTARAAGPAGDGEKTFLGG
ncbi:MAG: AAA family ATPase [Proteobacteria bacterium]|nr:AAA family ATPase [Pseudomonadota bacterium]